MDTRFNEANLMKQCLMFYLSINTVLSEISCPVSEHFFLGHYDRECYYISATGRCSGEFDHIAIWDQPMMNFLARSMDTHSPGICVSLRLKKRDEDWVWSSGARANFSRFSRESGPTTFVNWVVSFLPFGIQLVKMCPPNWTWKSWYTTVYLDFAFKRDEIRIICKTAQQMTNKQPPPHQRKDYAFIISYKNMYMEETAMGTSTEATAAQCIRKCTSYPGDCEVINFNPTSRICRLFQKKEVTSNVQAGAQGWFVWERV